MSNVEQFSTTEYHFNLFSELKLSKQKGNYDKRYRSLHVSVSQEVYTPVTREENDLVCASISGLNPESNESLIITAMTVDELEELGTMLILMAKERRESWQQ